jgi:hypothetical protein
MQLSSKWSRRNFLGSAGAIAGFIATVGKSFGWARAASPAGATITGFGDEARIRVTPQEASKWLRSAKPPMVIGSGEGRPGLTMNSFMLQPGEDKIVAQQLAKVFREHAA